MPALNSVIVPDGVIRPTRWPRSSANHKFLSGPTVFTAAGSDTGTELGDHGRGATILKHLYARPHAAMRRKPPRRRALRGSKPRPPLSQLGEQVHEAASPNGPAEPGRWLVF